MDSLSLNTFIAWNGVSFHIPETWEMESLEDTHVMVGEHGLPAMELKWSEPPSSVPLERHFRNFRARSQKLLNIIIREQPAPPFFHPRLPVSNFLSLPGKALIQKGLAP